MHRAVGAYSGSQVILSYVRMGDVAFVHDYIIERLGLSSQDIAWRQNLPSRHLLNLYPRIKSGSWSSRYYLRTARPPQNLWRFVRIRCIRLCANGCFLGSSWSRMLCRKFFWLHGRVCRNFEGMPVCALGYWE